MTLTGGMRIPSKFTMFWKGGGKGRMEGGLLEGFYFIFFRKVVKICPYLVLYFPHNINFMSKRFIMFH